MASERSTTRLGYPDRNVIERAAANTRESGTAIRWKRSEAGPSLPPVLSPGAAALLRLLKRKPPVDDVWAALHASSRVKGGSKDINSALSELRKQHEWHTAVQVYEWLILRGPSFKPDVSLYNLIMECYGKTQQSRKALAVFEAMQVGVDTVKGAVRGWCPATEAPGRGAVLDGQAAGTPEATDLGSCSGTSSDQSAAAMAEACSGVASAAGPVGASLGVAVQTGACLPSEASWNVLISTFSRAGDLLAARRAYEDMLRRGYRPSLVTYNCMLEVLGSSRDPTAAEAMWRRMKEEGVGQSTNSHTLMIAAYCKAGQLPKAESLFRSMYHARLLPNQATFLVLIAAYASAYMPTEAEASFQGMLRMGFQPDSRAFKALLAAYRGDAPGGVRCLQRAQDAGVEADAEMLEAVLESLAEAGLWEELEELVATSKEGGQGKKDVVRWRLHAYASAGKVEKVTQLMNELRETNGEAKGLLPAGTQRSDQTNRLEALFADSKLLALGRSGNLEELFALLEGQQTEGPLPLWTVNTVVQVLSESGSFPEAEELFSTIEELTGDAPNGDSFAALMSGHASRRNVRKCVSILKRMTKAGVSCSERVRRLLFAACRSREQKEEVLLLLQGPQ